MKVRFLKNVSKEIGVNTCDLGRRIRMGQIPPVPKDGKMYDITPEWRENVMQIWNNLRLTKNKRIGQSVKRTCANRG